MPKNINWKALLGSLHNISVALSFLIFIILLSAGIPGAGYVLGAVGAAESLMKIYKFIQNGFQFHGTVEFSSDWLSDLSLWPSGSGRYWMTFYFWPKTRSPSYPVRSSWGSSEVKLTTPERAWVREEPSLVTTDGGCGH